jgi:hypothetical protein
VWKLKKNKSALGGIKFEDIKEKKTGSFYQKAAKQI